jgi:hypothetical protein
MQPNMEKRDTPDNMRRTANVELNARQRRRFKAFQFRQENLGCL